MGDTSASNENWMGIIVLKVLERKFQSKTKRNKSRKVERRYLLETVKSLPMGRNLMRVFLNAPTYVRGRKLTWVRRSIITR